MPLEEKIQQIITIGQALNHTKPVYETPGNKDVASEYLVKHGLLRRTQLKLHANRKQETHTHIEHGYVPTQTRFFAYKLLAKPLKYLPLQNRFANN